MLKLSFFFVVMKLCFATNNKNKLNELRSAIGSQIQIVSLSDIKCFEEIPETGDTLDDNSLQKAQYIWDKFNIATIADDTGLEVESLDGRPGVYSARYAGANCDSNDNMNKMLSELDGVENREAAFKTIVTYLNGDEMHQFTGVCKGSIRKERSGVDGFGYDPIFQPNGFNITFAEMKMEDKNKISHRGIAVRKLIAFIQSL